MRQETLACVLKPIHRQTGLKLVELDDHILVLQWNDKRIAFFNQDKVTIEAIHKAADTWMVETDAVSYTVDPAVKILYQEHPFYDKRLTMQDFMDYMCGRRSDAVS